MIAPVKLITAAGVAVTAMAGGGILQAQGPFQPSTDYGQLLLLLTGIGGLVTVIVSGIALLIKAWRDGQIALLKAMDEKVSTAILKVDETLAETKVISHATNSAATKADTARLEQEDKLQAERLVGREKGEAIRVAVEAERALFRETIADLRAVAVALAQAQATRDAIVATAKVTSPAPAASVPAPVAAIDAVKDALKP